MMHWLVGVLWAAFSLPVAEDIRHGTAILHLGPPEYGVDFIGKFSPDSAFIVGISVLDTVIYPESNLYLWDLRRIDPDGKFRRPEPLATYALADHAGVELWDDQLAFSPGSQTLAFLLKTEILLLNVPDLTLRQQISFTDLFDDEGIGQIQWSLDGRLLAASDESGGLFAVWNRTGKWSIPCGMSIIGRCISTMMM